MAIIYAQDYYWQEADESNVSAWGARDAKESLLRQRFPEAEVMVYLIPHGSSVAVGPVVNGTRTFTPVPVDGTRDFRVESSYRRQAADLPPKGTATAWHDLMGKAEIEENEAERGYLEDCYFLEVDDVPYDRDEGLVFERGGWDAVWAYVDAKRSVAAQQAKAAATAD